jgi:hypothetical protein
MKIVFEKIPMFGISLVWDVEDTHITVGILIGIFIIAIQYKR